MPEVYSKKPEKAGGGAGVVDAVSHLINNGFQRSAWHSMTAMPKGVNFEAQNDDENIVLFLRAHPITNLPWIALILVLFWIPLFWIEFPLLSVLTPAVRLALTLTWYLGLAFVGFQNFMSWFYNVYIVTDERVVDVDFYGLFYKDVKTAQISRLEDANYTQRGMLASFFNYGTVMVETASEQRTGDMVEGSGAFDFENVPNPNEVVKVISELMEKEDKDHEIRR